MNFLLWISCMAIGNHIPWNVPPEAVKLYLDLADELAYRG